MGHCVWPAMATSWKTARLCWMAHVKNWSTTKMSRHLIWAAAMNADRTKISKATNGASAGCNAGVFMQHHYDTYETQPPEERERRLFERLPEALARAKVMAPGIARQLQGIDPSTVTSGAALAAIPVQRKTELL